MTFCVKIPAEELVTVLIRDKPCLACDQIKEFCSRRGFSFNPFYYMTRFTESVDVFIYTKPNWDEATYRYFQIFLPDDSLYPGGERKINLAIGKIDQNPSIVLIDEEEDEYLFEESLWYEENCKHLLGNIECKDFAIEICRDGKIN